MPFKIVIREIDANGMLGEPANLTGPLTRTEANLELAARIKGRQLRATSEGWNCEEADGSRCLISMERC